mmetsp:Transcript_1301/g.3542  ORF Transcript_1301/g.3542 Transcript_1301/m.3542 type:complete len:500 (-) Transcript_1301:255-1754(-)
MMIAVARQVALLLTALLAAHLLRCDALSIDRPSPSSLRMSAASAPVSSTLPSSSRRSFVILGGTGRIGTAVASHLLLRAPESKIVLAGRDEKRGRDAVGEVLGEHPKSFTAKSDGESSSDDDRVSFVQLDWRDEEALAKAVEGADCLIHTAGPYLGEEPIPLSVAIRSRLKAYVDVSDPLDFLDESLSMSDCAASAGLSAVLAAGAFPGMSNVLSVEAAKTVTGGRKEGVRDMRFNYFTAGLGGSGDVNLYITNLGFGEPMAQFDKGSLRFFEALSGLLLGKVSFFIEGDAGKDAGFGNEEAMSKIGRQTVFSWPFPEAATVPRSLGGISGDSSAAMGTAPDVWNGMLGILVSLVPRPLWRSSSFSQFLADFSQPLVKATDVLLRLVSSDDVGETHAMRIDVTGECGTTVAVVQAHESFRRCVGQSCAEFAMDMLENPSPGVQLTEERYFNDDARRRIIQRLTSTPGTMAFTGPVEVNAPSTPSKMEDAIAAANRAETK